LDKGYKSQKRLKLWAKNNDKKGATFIFDIPAKRVETSGNQSWMIITQFLNG
jgi:hypothetical protein